MKTLEEIKEFLNTEDVDQDIARLIAEYAKNGIKQCRNLISFIPSLATQQIEHLNEISQRRIQGIEEMIHLYSEDTNESLPLSGLIPSTIHAVMEYFPDGHATFASPAGQKFFKRFCEALASQRYEYINSYWATEIIPCNDYLKKVLEIWDYWDGTDA